MTGMTRSDHRDVDQFDALHYDEKDWELAHDLAAQLLLDDPEEFERHVLAETGLDIGVQQGLLVLRIALEGYPLPPLDSAIRIIILDAYNAAVDRLARRELERGPR